MASTQMNKLQTAAGTAKTPMLFTDALEKFKPQLKAALPAHMSADRMVRLALTAFRQNEELSSCVLESIYASIIIASQLGLEPGVLGQGWLIPYKQRDGSRLCQFIPGWQGLVDIVSRTGRASVWTEAVRDGEFFEYEKGSNPIIRHKPDINADESKGFIAVYACGKIRGGEVPVMDVWGVERVMRHRARNNKVGDRHYSYKGAHNFEMYARKVVLMQILKYMPKSAQLQAAYNLDEAGTLGVQPATIDAAIQPLDTRAEWQPPIEFVEKLDVLDWTPAATQRWFADNASMAPEQIHSLLNAEIDRMNDTGR